MFDNIILLMTNAFEIYVIYKFLGDIWGNMCVSRKTAVAMYGTGYFVTSYVMLFESYPILNLLSCCILFLLIMLCYRATVYKKIIVSIMIYICLFVSEAIVALVIGLADYQITEKAFDNVTVAVSVMDVIIFSIIIVIVERFINVSADIKVPKLFIIVISLVFMSSVILLTMVFHQKNINYIFSCIALVCVLISSFTIIYLYDSIAKLFDERTKSELMKRERTYYHNQSVLLQKNTNDLREFRHDINNKLMVIKQYAYSNELDKLVNYINEITAKMGKTKTYSLSGNFAIDNIINYKLSEAAEKGITVTTDIVMPGEINVEDDDMVVIIGNLLDNAIEAVKKLKDNRHINIILKMKNNSIFLNIENNHNNEINTKSEGIITTKDDKKMHGIGLNSVKNTVYKYDGIFEMKYDDKKFDVTIIL